MPIDPVLVCYQVPAAPGGLGPSEQPVTVLAPLPVTVTGSSSANPAAGATGAAVPVDAGYTGFSVGGTLTGVSAANPLPVLTVGTVGSVVAQQAKIATTGTAQALASSGTLINGIVITANASNTG